MKGTVYLIHLESKIAHAQHYIGWAKFYIQRVRHHRNGTGAKFLAEAVRREINARCCQNLRKHGRKF